MPDPVSHPTAWARKNKKDFANRLITQSKVEPHEEPAAFFMAGLPGAGKTEFTEGLIADLNLRVVRIDTDEIASQIDGYRAEEAHAFKEGATMLLNKVFDRATHRKVDFIMDGTFRSPSAISNVTRSISKGYFVKVFYIHQEPDIAWSFTKAREIVEKRSIDLEGFIRAYTEIDENLRALMKASIPQVTFDLVIKDASNNVGHWYENVTLEQIDKYVNRRYNKDELERMLEQ